MNKRHKISCLILYILLWICPSVFAQTQFVNAIRFTTEDGLPDNHVNDIVQDELGFIWLGTHEGLCRFDGSQMKVYQHDPKIPNSLLYNRISKILPDKHRIWTTTSAGISVLDIVTDTFTNYIYNKEGDRVEEIPKNRLAMSGLYKDQRGGIWCGTRGQGLGRYNAEIDDFEFFQYKGKKHLDLIQNPTRVHDILGVQENFLNDSIMWFGTNRGLLEFNRFTEKVEWLYFSHTDKTEEVDRNTFRCMYQHSNGLLYMGNWSEHIYVFDPINRILKPIPIKNKTQVYTGVNTLLRKNDSEIWITSSTGLRVYNIDTEELTLELKNKEKDNKCYGARCIDDQERFWTHHYNGVYCFDPVLQQFDHQSYAHLNGELWGFARKVFSLNNNKELIVSAQNATSLYHLDRGKGVWTAIPVPEKYYARKGGSLHGRSMIKNPGGDFTINNLEELFTLDPNTWEIKDFPFYPKLEYNSIRDILWDSQGRFWMGTFQDGLIRWDPKTGQSRNFQPELSAAGPQYPVTVITKLFEDSQKNIWMKRGNGFSVYLSDRDTMLNILSPLNQENSFPSVGYFAEDRYGRIWISSTQGMIGYADVNKPEEGVLKKINLKEVDPTIRWFGGMRTGPDGNIWILGTHNLIKLDAEHLQTTLFSYDYGIKDNEFFSFDFLDSGEMAIGLRGSIVIINPQTLQKNTELPEPFITNIEVLDKQLTSDTAAIMLGSLNLKYWENFFSFDFSARGFTMPEHIQFRYRLKKFNEEWLDAKERRFANYTNVPSGDYVFQLQAANNEGVWNEAIYELPMSIATPWWQTWWFRLASLLLFSGIVYSIYRYRIFQIRKEAQLKSEFEKQLNNVEMNALRAQMNPHFLFNCLNSIDSYIIKNETKKASEYLNKFARLVRLILQNSRSNYVNLKDELESLDLYMSMECLRFRHKFGYKIKLQEGLEVENIEIPPMLIQPFIENAIWHGLMHIGDRYKGQVELSVEKQNGALNCIIEDNGIGRVKSAEIKKKKSMKGKKSMGMQITQDRIEMINKLYGFDTSVKIIDLNDENGQAKGTRVELNIPI